MDDYEDSRVGALRIGKEISMGAKTLNELRDRAHKTAVDHGFTDASPAEDIALMLMHSELELSEALEDIRAGRPLNDMHYEVRHTYDGVEDIAKVPGSELRRMRNDPRIVVLNAKPCGVPSELADVIIRVLHFAGKHGIDIEKAVEEKMAYNDSRLYRHGNKTL